MILRNNQLVGGNASRVTMPEEMRPAFEEGCYLIFMRWTALQLAIINEWGGIESKDKAKSLFDEVLDWFYSSKGTCSTVPPHIPPRPTSRRSQVARHPHP